MLEYLLVQELGKLSAIQGLLNTHFIYWTKLPGFWVPLSNKDVNSNLLISLLDVGWMIVLLAVNLNIVGGESLAF